MRFPDYEDHDAVGLADLVAAGEITAEELLEAALQRVDARNSEVNAVIRRFDERARTAAGGVVPGAGPLAGVPYPLKDLGVTLAGEPTTNGSRFGADRPAQRSSTLVERLQAAGLVIFGQTNSSEFGLSYATEPRCFGASRNPWRRDHSPGGSSGGAAAAVASGMVPAAHASDGGGSIRVPASCCGLFGLKPSRGRVPLGPVIGEAWSGLAGSHAVTRSVRDSAALLDAVAGPEPGDPYAAPPQVRPYLDEVGRDPGRLRIALHLEATPRYPTDPGPRAAAEDVARLCEDLGHIVEPAAPPHDPEAFENAFTTLVAGHIAADVDRLEAGLGRSLREGEVERLTADLVALGRRTAAPAFVAARETLQVMGRQLGAFLQDYDVVLSPTLAQPPAPLGKLDTDAPDAGRRLAAYSPFTQIANAAGCPAMSVPLARSPEELPLGVMFLGSLGREDLLFRLGGQLETARPWFHRRPAWICS